MDLEDKMQESNVILQENQDNSDIVKAMDKWSGNIFRLFLPSNIGSKANIKQVNDEDATLFSIGVYTGLRKAVQSSIPYDGSRYEGQTIRDESTGTLWAYNANFPDGFGKAKGESFNISLGHIFKCHTCHGQGRVTCWKCNGKVRWTTKNSSGESKEHVCTCGDGKQDCYVCDGYGELLKVLEVKTSYKFNEEQTKDYSGKLKDSFLKRTSGNVIFKHISEFEKRVIAEAIDGFDSEEFTRLMEDMHLELRHEIEKQLSEQLTNPDILYNLIDDYFDNIENPVDINKRLDEEILPVRMKCEAINIPIRSVKYNYKDKDYSLYTYGKNAKVWVDGKQPSELTWKVAVFAFAVFILVLYSLIPILINEGVLTI